MTEEEQAAEQCMRRSGQQTHTHTHYASCSTWKRHMDQVCFWWNVVVLAACAYSVRSYNVGQTPTSDVDTTPYDAQPCYFHLTDLEGSIESPNYPDFYPPNQECCYDIKRPSQDYCGVKLTIDDFHLEHSDRKDKICYKDWLSVDFCVPEGGSRFCGVLNGSKYEYPFQSGARALRLHFHSDGSGEASGFRIRYQLIERCTGVLYAEPPISSIGTTNSLCYTRIRDRRGVINSPFFPNPYPHNLDCVYEFVRADPFVCGVRMRTQDFHLEAPMDTPFGGACSDFFHMPSCGFLCGKFNFTWKAQYQPGATSMKFHFHSDDMTNLSGFAINFEQVYVC